MANRDRIVALFLPSLIGGGAERIMVTLANSFAALGLPVDLVVVQAKGEYLEDVGPGVRLVELGGARVLFSLPALVGYLRRERPCVLLSALSHANLIALWARKLAGGDTRVVVSEHNTLSHDLTDEPIGRAGLMPWLMRRCYPWANAIIAVSSGVAEDLAQSIGLARERIDVVYNPTVTESQQQLSRQPVDHPWFAPGEPPVIIAVGRLTAQKDFSTLIRAFAAFRHTQPARLVILGEGELRGELEALADELEVASDVAMPGFAANPYAYMSRATLFVLSSAWEGLPGVLIEAMACGTPVISTDCPSGPAEILENGKWGRLVPVGDVPALTRAIAETLAEEGAHTDVSARAACFGLYQSTQAYLRVMAIPAACTKTP